MAQPLIGPIEIIKISWQNFYRNLRSYAEFMLIMLLLSAILTTYGVFLQVIVAEQVEAATIYGLVSFPVSLAFTVVNLAFIDFTAKTLQKKRGAIRESLLIGAHKLISFIWISLLAGVIVFGGTLLLIIPGLIFSLWYLFASTHLIVDGTRGYAALKASRALVVGRWWAVLWRVAVPTIFYYLALRFAIWVVFLVLGSLAGDPKLFLAAPPEDSGWAPILIRTIVPTVIYSLGIALTVAATLVLWLDLKRTRT